MFNKELLRERPITIIEGLPHTQLEDVAWHATHTTIELAHLNLANSFITISFHMA